MVGPLVLPVAHLVLRVEVSARPTVLLAEASNRLVELWVAFRKVQGAPAEELLRQAQVAQMEELVEQPEVLLEVQLELEAQKRLVAPMVSQRLWSLFLPAEF